MPSVSSVQLTGDAYIDGVLSGTKWATYSLTYSFPTDASFYGTPYGNSEPTNNFEAFTTQQQDAVRDVLQMYSSVTNLTFTEVTETSTTHGDLRYAESDSVGTAWGYYPSTSAAGGDTWFNNSKNWYDNPIQGNYAYLTMMHETGHALGLKHPHEVKGSFGAMPADHDSLEYTVMSYHSYVGSPLSGYTNETNSYPQTLMMYDIAALQEMYGANYTTNSADTVYSWSATTGEMFLNGVGQGASGGNKIFMTVWDGGGNDTYNFSNYATNLTVDLNPGGWTTTSATQLAYLGNGHYAIGNIANSLLYHGNTASLIENAVGGTGSDRLIGNVADNKLTGGAGNDILDGGAGVDTAIYSGSSASYQVVHNADGTWTITGADGIDTLSNMEFAQFGDTLMALDGYTPPPPVNIAPAITSQTQSVSLAEWADQSANELANAAHVASGAISYSDPDTGDVHSASFAAQGTGYLGTFQLNTGNIESGTVGWTFSVADNVMDYLTAGQTLTQVYNVTIDDGHGGTANQSVTITLVGAADPVVQPNSAPVITSTTQAASLTEWADQSANEIANALHVATSSISYTDANSGDVHSASFAAQGTGYLGTFQLNTGNIESGTVGWTFSVADNVMDYLKAGQTLTQVYNVTVDDGHGGTAGQAVTITLVGADDPVVKGKGGTGGPKKGAAPAGQDIAGSDAGYISTPATVNSHGAKNEMWDDQAAAPVSSDSITIVGVADTHDGLYL